MQKILVPIHSFVDLITNSSSELFVCDTKKSVEAVKEIIEKLAELYNEKIKFIDDVRTEINIDHLWTGIFNEPEVCKFDFSLYNFPHSDEWFNMYPLREDLRTNCGYEKSDIHPVLKLVEEKLTDWERANPAPKYPSTGTLHDPGKLNQKDEYAYNKAWTAYKKKRDAFEKPAFAPWSKLELDIRRRLYEWAARTNGLDLSPFKKLKILGGRYSTIYFKDDKNAPEITEFVKAIDDAIFWDYQLKKGSILLSSAGDNTIPYDFFSEIEGAFGHVKRMHIG